MYSVNRTAINIEIFSNITIMIVDTYIKAKIFVENEYFHIFILHFFKASVRMKKQFSALEKMDVSGTVCYMFCTRIGYKR